jgi:hypothetical protein
MINDTTNNDGLLQIVDAPPAVDTYNITVSKDGYSTERTYKIGEPSNPNPTDRNPTVVVKSLTQISFFLQYVRDLSIISQDESCSPIANIDLALQGSRLIGNEPDILKYNATSTTDAAGQKIISDLDYDTYELGLLTTDYLRLGTATTTSINHNASSTGEIKLNLAKKLADSMLITVKDSNESPLSGANIELKQGTTTIAAEITGPGALACREEGQALFTAIAPGNYTLTISKNGFQDYTEDLELGSLWINKEIILNP